MRSGGLLLIVLFGCGGGGGSTVDAPPVPDAPPFADAPPIIDASPPDANATLVCDTTAQDCTDPDNPKCTFAVVGGMFATACVPEIGMRAEGMTCTRTTENDDCAIGLYCAGVGLMSGSTRCRAMCDHTAGCTVAGEHCLSIDGNGPLAGFCVPTCDLFGTACATGMSCSITVDIDATGVGVCRMNGAGASGTACSGNADCMANMNCVASACTELCDAAHACPGGTTCMHVTGLPNNGGYCQ